MLKVTQWQSINELDEMILTWKVDISLAHIFIHWSNEFHRKFSADFDDWTNRFHIDFVEHSIDILCKFQSWIYPSKNHHLLGCQWPTSPIFSFPILLPLLVLPFFVQARNSYLWPGSSTPTKWSPILAFSVLLPLFVFASILLELKNKIDVQRPTEWHCEKLN